MKRGCNLLREGTSFSQGGPDPPHWIRLWEGSKGTTYPLTWEGSKGDFIPLTWEESKGYFISPYLGGKLGGPHTPLFGREQGRIQGKISV